MLCVHQSVYFFTLNLHMRIDDMIPMQRANLNDSVRMDQRDMARVIRHANGDIFGNECCLWNGYVTRSGTHSSYINFWFKGKKTSLHRLLYNNFVGDLEDTAYLKYTCSNKGVCCNVNHIVRCNNVVPAVTTQTLANKFVVSFD